MTDKEILSKVDVEKVDWLKISNKSVCLYNAYSHKTLTTCLI